MNLGFHDQVVPFIEDGSKTHTIRAGERWKVGMRADLYRELRRRKVYELRATNIPPRCICHGDGLMGMRCSAVVHAPAKLEYERVQVAGMQLIFRAPVVRVEKISIREVLIGSIMPEGSLTEALPRVVIEIDGVRLRPDEADAFAWRDGFRRKLPSSDPRVLRGQEYSEETTGCFRTMMDFWAENHGLGLQIHHFHGQLVHWNYDQRFTGKRSEARER